MKEIPNKIYIDEDLINYHCLTYRCDGDLEYIRKDVLINWLKEHINDYLVHGRDIDLMFDDIKNAF